MRFEWTIKASSPGEVAGTRARFPTAQKTRPHLPFVLFLGRTVHYFLPQARSRIGRMHLQDGTGPNNRSIWLGFPCLRRFLPVPWPRWSDFRGSFSFPFSENGTAKPLCLDLSSRVYNLLRVIPEKVSGY